MSSMWLIVIVLFLHPNIVYASAPVDLELLFNNGLKNFITSESVISKSANSETCVNPLILNGVDQPDEDDAWEEHLNEAYPK